MARATGGQGGSSWPPLDGLTLIQRCEDASKNVVQVNRAFTRTFSPTSDWHLKQIMAPLDLMEIFE